MADTWNINTDGSVQFNNTTIPNPKSVEVLYRHDLTLGQLEVQVTIDVEDASSVAVITQALSVLPDPPTLEQLHIPRPRHFLKSRLGDTVITQALTLVQGPFRPDKEGV